MDSHSINEIPKQEIEAVGYAWGGQEIDPTQSKCLAKEVQNKSLGTTQYFIKSIQGVPGMGGFINPSDPMFNESILTRQVSHLGKPAADFIKVKKESFDLYKTFLRTKNSVFCRQAENQC